VELEAEESQLRFVSGLQRDIVFVGGCSYCFDLFVFVSLASQSIRLVEVGGFYRVARNSEHLTFYADWFLRALQFCWYFYVEE